MATTRPAVADWFLDGDEPQLLGGRCGGCGAVTFPRREGLCPNPRCDAQDVEQVALSRRARVWSYATNHYDPPAPAVVTAPYTVVAATLVEERLTVLGLLAPGTDPSMLRVGDEVEVASVALHVDDEGDTRTVWGWRPVAADRGGA